MKTAKDYIDFLVQRGYSSAGNQFICGYLEYTDLEKKDTLGHVTLFTRYTEEYTKELESLPEVFHSPYSIVIGYFAFVKKLP